MNAQVDNWILLFVAAAAQGFFLFFPAIPILRFSFECPLRD